jgi:hypothetical protein
VAVQKDLMISLARCGEHERAADMADRIRKGAASDPGSLVDVACTFAVCSGAVAANEGQLRERYAERALEALRQAVAQGYRDVINLETEPDLDALRDRPEFQAILTDLTNRAPK